MGLMDKVKKASEQALSKAQEGVKEGRAKLDEVQAKRQWDALLRNLGAAVYAEQREEGPAAAVTAAMAALDDHARAHGAGETGAAPVGGDGVSPPEPPAPGPTETESEGPEARSA